MILKDFNKTALIDGETHVSYRELIDHVRAYTTLFSIEKGDRVVIFSENRLEWIYACYAVWNQAGITVPIDFYMPAETLAFILNDCKPAVIFSSNKGAEKLLSIGDSLERNPQIILFEDVCEPSGALPLMRQAYDMDDTAIIVYTSGTTGAPKGVMLSYTNLMATIQGMIDFKIMRKHDRVLGLLPLHHIYPLQGTIFLPLYVGATVVYVHELNSAEILENLQKHKITFLIGVPRLYELFHKNIYAQINSSPVARALVFIARQVDSVRLSKMLFGKIHAKFGGHMRLYASGGSKLDKEMARDMKALGFILDEGYGVTETAPLIAFNPFDRIRLGAAGLPLGGTQVKIVDGEIAVKGPNVMQGYFKNPEQTAKKIRGGWFYTGDTGYFDDDGYLYVTGRKDDMIVLPSGKNINPEDIEKDILSISPMVEDIGVMQRDGKLAALVYPNYPLLKKDNIINVMETIKWKVIDKYNSNVEHYKKIFDISILKEPLPKTNLGKLQRFLMDSVNSYGERKPRDIPEPRLGEYPILKKFLFEHTTKEIYPDDHFDLDLGLDSLGKVELVVYIENTFGVELSDKDLAEHNTVQTLAEFISEQKTRTDDTPVNWKAIFSSDMDFSFSKDTRAFMVFKTLLNPLASRYLRVKTDGMEKLPEAPFILAPNHQSYLDAVLLIAKLPKKVLADTYFVAKEKQIYKSRFGSWLTAKMHVIVVNIDKDLKSSLKKIAMILKHGRNVVIFPEGIRSRDGKLAPFKKLFAILSRELSVPIVPLIIQGTYQSMPRGRALPRPAKICLSVGDPLYPEGREYQEICSAIEAIIAERIKDS